MKIFLPLLTVCLMLNLNLAAQNTVKLEINHKLGTTNFEMETAAKNNLDHDFKVTRLQYYISEITLTHDGGVETKIEDLWILVDAENPEEINLGTYDINAVEKISWHIGVDPDHNHMDPASYGHQHPLAPQFPSMHWGWDPGYRFVAIEGNGGAAFDQLFQLHGLDDINYFKSEIAIDRTAENNEITLQLDADYTRALEDIELNDGVIIHGNNLQAKQCLENFRDFVFSASAQSTATIDFSEVKEFSIYPNPSSSGIINVGLESSENFIYTISVTDILGTQIIQLDQVNSNSINQVEIKQAGFYFVNLIKNDEVIISKKMNILK